MSEVKCPGNDPGGNVRKTIIICIHVSFVSCMIHVGVDKKAEGMQGHPVRGIHYHNMYLGVSGLTSDHK